MEARRLTRFGQNSNRHLYPWIFTQYTSACCLLSVIHYITFSSGTSYRKAAQASSVSESSASANIFRILSSFSHLLSFLSYSTSTTPTIAARTTHLRISFLIRMRLFTSILNCFSFFHNRKNALLTIFSDKEGTIHSMHRQTDHDRTDQSCEACCLFHLLLSRFKR